MNNNTWLIPSIAMPTWAIEVEREALQRPFHGDEAKMRFVIQLALENVKHATGGPFAAAIFDSATDQLVALGINVVVPSNQSWAHAEMIAYARAQALRQNYCLNDCMIATSCEPCAMCYGATPWSGVKRMIYGATKRDAENAGFDEGEKGDDWIAALQRRHIEVTGPLLSEEARAPFTLYLEKSGKIY